MTDDYVFNAELTQCSDCGGKSYGWPRCAFCVVRRLAEQADPRPVENLAGTLFEEAS